MKTIKCSVNINASRSQVWAALWVDKNYRRWTAVFGEGGVAISDWQEGSKIQFLATDGCGMFGIIEKKVIDEQMIFKHMGEVKDGQETISEWAGAREKYFLSGKKNTTLLQVEMDTKEKHAGYFESTFPKALEAVKAIAENIA